MVLAIDSYRYNALINKALTLSNLSRYNESLAYYDKVLSIDPGNEMALDGKGEALFKLGKYDQAVPYFDRILAMNSSDSSLLIDASRNKQLAIKALENTVNQPSDHDISNESNNNKNKNGANNTANKNIGKTAN